MEYIGIIKRIIFSIIFFFYLNCFAQEKNNSNNDYIFGKWKCVKHDYEGYHKFSFEQAEEIRISILNIEKCKLYYSNIDFIEPCNYSRFDISKYDTTGYNGDNIELIYTKKELSKILEFNPVDENGNSSCFNDCATFLLKQDTLINICGGYTFYLLKEKSNKEE